MSTTTKTGMRGLALGAVAFATIGQAFAAVYTFTYSDSSGNNGYGSLVTDATDKAISGSLTMDAGSVVGLYSLSSDPSTAFAYDNQLYPVSDPHMNTNGLFFKNAVREINIWGTGPGVYSFYGWTAAGGYMPQIEDGKFTLEAVPEPFTMALGAAGLVAAISRRRRAARS